MIIWLIGLSGSGKTTIGKEVYELYKQKNSNTVFLDGDILREVWGDSLGHDISGRQMNAHRISNLCLLLDQQNINVVACVLSIFPKWRDWNRKNFDKYFEIYIYSSIKILQKFDDKGIYDKAKKGKINNVVGLDIPFPEPKTPNLIIDNSKRDVNPKLIAKNILYELNQE